MMMKLLGEKGNFFIKKAPARILQKDKENWDI